MIRMNKYDFIGLGLGIFIIVLFIALFGAMLT